MWFSFLSQSGTETVTTVKLNHIYKDHFPGDIIEVEDALAEQWLACGGASATEEVLPKRRPRPTAKRTATVNVSAAEKRAE